MKQTDTSGAGGAETDSSSATGRIFRGRAMKSAGETIDRTIATMYSLEQRLREVEDKLANEIDKRLTALEKSPPPQPTQMTGLQALQWCAAHVGEYVYDKKGCLHRVMKDAAGCVYLSGGYLVFFHEKYEPYTTEKPK